MRKETDHGCQDFSLNIRFHFTLYLKCQLSLIIYYIIPNYLQNNPMNYRDIVKYGTELAYQIVRVFYLKE